MYCKKCGAFLPAETQFCTKCGEACPSPAPQQNDSEPKKEANEPQAPHPQQDVKKGTWQQVNTQEEQSRAYQWGQKEPQEKKQWQQTGNPIPNHKSHQSGQSDFICALAYIPILFWLPLVAAQEHPHGRQIANQGLVLLISHIICSGIQKISSGFFSDFLEYFIPFPFFDLSGLFFGLISLALTIFTIVGFIKTLTGSYFEIPLIGKIRIID